MMWIGRYYVFYFDGISECINRAKEVQSMVGLSRTALWRLENKGEFPRRINFSGNSVGWKLSETKQWIDGR